MANFFSADYWKALYFKAMGGQETAVDPNAMSGSFAGSSSWTGTASATGSSAGDMSGSFAGSSTWTGNLTRKRSGDAGDAPRKKRRINIVGPSLQWARDNLERFLGPNADRSKLDELLERESAPQPVETPKAEHQAVSLDAADPAINQAGAQAVDGDEEDEIIALLLAA